MRRMTLPACAIALLSTVACNGASDGTGSEIATSVVSGALNNTSGSQIGFDVPREHKGVLERVVDELDPIGTAHAAQWQCTGGSLDPMFSGPGAYSWTPVACSVTWAGGKTASSQWSGTFSLDYGASCDRLHPWIGNQAGGCTLTRSTATGGNTRTITGPDGGMYAVTHDTHGDGTGWDASVAPAPTNDGVVATCDAGGCQQGGTLVIHGSHLTGTVTPSGGTAKQWWDHTVSTGDGGLTITANGSTRVVNGTVTVQHNLAKFTSTTTFDNVGWGDATCCFPTTGSVTTSFADGPDKGKTESLTFGAACGEATLKRSNGSSTSYTLSHCI